jgi:hypothetical protein
MDYEAMWNELKAKIEKDLKYHQSGFMQSIGEACHGQLKCEEFLGYMKKIEEQQNLKR